MVHWNLLKMGIILLGSPGIPYTLTKGTLFESTLHSVPKYFVCWSQKFTIALKINIFERLILIFKEVMLVVIRQVNRILEHLAQGDYLYFSYEICWWKSTVYKLLKMSWTFFPWLKYSLSAFIYLHCLGEG